LTLILILNPCLANRQASPKGEGLLPSPFGEGPGVRRLARERK